MKKFSEISGHYFPSYLSHFLSGQSGHYLATSGHYLAIFYSAAMRIMASAFSIIIDDFSLILKDIVIENGQNGQIKSLVGL